MAGVVMSSPELIHTNAVDSEEDNLTYSYELYADAGMTQLVDHSEDVPEDPGGTTTWQVSATLNDNQVYYWRVQASDLYETGEWSGLAEFWVNSVNQIPTPVDLLLPADGSTLDTLIPTFQWTASTDSDPYDVVSYTLTYSADSAFADATAISDIGGIEYTLSSPLDPADTYYWKVTADDMFGAGVESNQVFTFGFLIRGDANADGQIDVGDATYIISYVFRGGPPPDPYELGDANCDTSVDVGDAVYLINYVFKDGPPPGCE
jgi:hypothetical protein